MEEHLLEFPAQSSVYHSRWGGGEAGFVEHATYWWLPAGADPV